MGEGAAQRQEKGCFINFCVCSLVVRNYVAFNLKISFSCPQFCTYLDNMMCWKKVVILIYLNVKSRAVFIAKHEVPCFMFGNKNSPAFYYQT